MTSNEAVEGESAVSGGSSVAIVSGKGGSGKTLVATAMGIGLATSGLRVALVDADLGTGGLTYYLGFTEFSGAREGLADILLGEGKLNTSRLSRPKSGMDAMAFSGALALLPVGSNRSMLLVEERSDIDVGQISEIIADLKKENDLVIVDCRGGVDLQSLAVCATVDDVVMVVETDAASVKASQRLIDTLSARGLSKKLAGFVLNKVMDNPKTLASAGRSLLSTDFLGAIPFDLETTRDFIRGELPRPRSLFQSQVSWALARIFPKLQIVQYRDPMSDSEFDSISTESPELKTGRIFVGFSMVLMFLLFLFVQLMGSNGLLYESDVYAFHSGLYLLTALLAGCALSSRVLEAIGRVMRAYAQLSRRFLPIFFLRR